MIAHNIGIHELPKKIKKKYQIFLKAKNSEPAKHLNSISIKSRNKTLSTGMKKAKDRVNTDANYSKNKMTARHKISKANMHKVNKNSSVDNLISKSNSNTRDKDKIISFRAGFDIEHGGDSLKALDELMAAPIQQTKNANTFCVKKNSTKFKSLRRGNLRNTSIKKGTETRGSHIFI